MIFQIVQPFVTDIYGDSFKEAIKNYVKFNHNVNITNLIIKDQSNHYQATLRYYMENNKNKVGIDVYPYTNVSYPTIASIGPSIYPISTSPSIYSISTNPSIYPISTSPSIYPISTNPSIYPISTSPMVTVKNSPYIANNNNVLIQRPRFF